MSAKDTTIRQGKSHLVQDVVARHRSRQVPLVRQDTPIDRRLNSIGAVYSPDARYLYFARKYGGFAYNLQFPQWLP